MAVLTTDDEGYEAVAERIAAERDEPVVRDVADVPGDEPVVFVDDPAAVDDMLLLALQERQLRGDPVANRFSVITGYTPEHASQLYFEEHDYDGDHCLLPPGPPEIEVDDDLAVLDAKDTTVADMVDAQGDGFQSLALHTAGWSLHLYLSDGYVCGYPETVSPDDFPDAHQPYCVTDGERDCPLDGDLLSAEAIEASHLFVVSCASMLDNNDTGMPVNVGIGLLTGADSMIGGYRVNGTDPRESMLHYSLLRAGYSVSERCYLLNRNAERANVKQYPYVAFGRPELRASDAVPSEATTSTTAIDGGVAVEIADASGYVADVRVPADAVEGDDVYVRTEPGDAPWPYYLVFREGEDYRLLLFGADAVDDASTTVELRATPTSQPEREMIFDTVRNAARLRRLGLHSTRTDRQSKHLRNRVRSLADELRLELFELEAHDDIDDTLADLFEDVQSVHDEMLHAFLEMRPLYREYGEHVQVTDMYAEGWECHDCGRRLFVKEAADPVGEVGRGMAYCSRCGQQFDVPTFDGEPPQSYPTIRQVEDGDSPALEVSFRNPLDRHMYATLALTVSPFEPTEVVDEGYVSPSSADAVLAPGEEWTTTFTTDPDAFGDNHYIVHACVVGNLELYDGMGRLLVGDQRGYRPWHRN
jgi:DNA-directed RNA polymerase subunit RPC12/RpoP